MRRHVSLQFWSRVRTFNWIASGIWIVCAGVVSFFNFIQDDDFPGRTAYDLAFTRDGRTVVGSGSVIRSGLQQGEVYGWDVATGKRLWTEVIPGTAGTPSTLMPNRSSVVTLLPVRSGSEGRTPSPTDSSSFRYWLCFRDARSGRLTNTSLATPQPVPYSSPGIDVAPDGKSIAATFVDRVVVWSAEPGNNPQVWRLRTFLQPKHESSRSIGSALFTGDGRHLVVFSEGFDDKYGRNVLVDLWDARTGTRVHAFRESHGNRKPLPETLDMMAVLSPDRQRIATVVDKNVHLRLWDVGTGNRLAETSVPGLDGALDSLGFLDTNAENGNYKVTVTSTDVPAHEAGKMPSDHTIVHWETKPSRVRTKASDVFVGLPAAKAFSPDGRVAAVSPGRWHDDRLAILTDAHTGREIRVLEGDGGL